MTSPIGSVRSPQRLSTQDDQGQVSGPESPKPKPSVADAWARFEETGDWCDAVPPPSDRCIDSGVEEYERCSDNARNACKLFPYMATVAGSGTGRVGGSPLAWLGGVAGKLVGDEMTKQCLDVADVQCRTKEAAQIDACASIPRYTVDDLPLFRSDAAVPHYAPEDFPVASDHPKKP